MGGIAAAAVRRLALFVAAVAVGWAVAAGFGLHGVERSPAYFLVASTLLAVGLFGSAHGISPHAVRSNLRVVVLAVTVGVLAKALLIGAVMVLCFGSPAFLVLGVAVAQIDPLSVAAMNHGSRLSPGGRAVLAAWSAFDDPVTMLLTVYLSGFALGMLGRTPVSGSAADGGVLSLLADLGVNLLFAACAFALWKAVRRHRVLAFALLAVVFAVAIWQFLMLGLALTALFLRPGVDRLLDRAVQVAFLVASVGLGVLLVNGVHVLAGAALGAAAFAAQAVVSPLITRGLPGRDRGFLAVSQQNGITAIILALLLEPDFPLAVGVIGPAIVVVNLLHATAATAWAARRPEAVRSG